MVSRWFKHWVWAGIEDNARDDICPIRLTNLISLIFLVVLVLQIPFALSYWSQGGQAQSLLCLSAASVCPLVYFLNRYRLHFQASGVLVGIYTVYFCLSSLVMGQITNSHDFFILGVFAVPFVFEPSKKAWAWCVMLFMAALFMLFELGLPASLSFYPLAQEQFQSVTRANNVLWLALCVALCAYQVHRNLYQSRHKLQQEQQRAESLLLNILPHTIARRLKHSPSTMVEPCDSATVLFADIQGFTALATKLPAGTLADFLNRVFSTFDNLCDQHGVVKIKTIGDAYMAAAGIPEQNRDHALLCCMCAKDMQDAFALIRDEFGFNNGLRIGIASGSVIAGIIGKSRFSYDIWGSTVNLAARLESQGDNDRIMISDLTHSLVRNKLPCAHHAPFSLKGLGQVAAYELLLQRHVLAFSEKQQKWPEKSDKSKQGAVSKSY